MSWSRDDDRDNFEFWEQQKNEYLKQNPSHGALLNEENEIEDVDVGSKSYQSVMKYLYCWT